MIAEAAGDGQWYPPERLVLVDPLGKRTDLLKLSHGNSSSGHMGVILLAGNGIRSTIVDKKMLDMQLLQDNGFAQESTDETY